MPSGDVTRSIGAVIEQGKREDPTSFASVMVHVDIEHDSERRVELAIGMADRFQAALIGVAGCALWPAFMVGNVGLTKSNQYDFQKVMARFEQKGKTFRAQGRSLKQIEWRSALESPGELLLREARAADLLVIGRRHSGSDDDPGVIVLRAGRPVLLVPDAVAALPLSPRGRRLEGYARVPPRMRSHSCSRQKRLCWSKSASMNRSRRKRRIWPTSQPTLCATA
jgi:nucleotide-binding universal stress UspA family protein